MSTDEVERVSAVSEQLDVQKRVVDRGGFRIEKSVQVRDVLVDEPLYRDEYTIERKPVNKAVSASEPPSIRHEGETMVVPVLEEVIVVQRRLMLKEELHVVRHRREYRDPHTIELRSEHVSVDRVDADGHTIEQSVQQEQQQAK